MNVAGIGTVSFDAASYQSHLLSYAHYQQTSFIYSPMRSINSAVAN